MGELALGARGDAFAGESVFGLDYLRTITDRLDRSVRRGEGKKSRKARMRRMTTRVERQAMRVRWTYLLNQSPLTAAEASELAMLSSIFAIPSRQPR